MGVAVLAGVAAWVGVGMSVGGSVAGGPSVAPPQATSIAKAKSAARAATPRGAWTCFDMLFPVSVGTIGLPLAYRAADSHGLSSGRVAVYIGELTLGAYIKPVSGLVLALG